MNLDAVNDPPHGEHSYRRLTSEAVRLHCPMAARQCLLGASGELLSELHDQQVPLDWTRLELAEDARSVFILFCLKRSVIPGKKCNWYWLEPELRRTIVEQSLTWSYYTALPVHVHWKGARGAFDCSPERREQLQIPSAFAAVLAQDGRPAWNKVRWGLSRTSQIVRSVCFLCRHRRVL